MNNKRNALAKKKLSKGALRIQYEFYNIARVLSSPATLFVMGLFALVLYTLGVWL